MSLCYHHHLQSFQGKIHELKSQQSSPISDSYERKTSQFDIGWSFFFILASVQDVVNQIFSAPCYKSIVFCYKLNCALYQARLFLLSQ